MCCWTVACITAEEIRLRICDMTANWSFPPPRLHPPWCPGLKKERPSQFLHLKNPVPESTHPSSGSRGSMAVWRHHSDHAGCCGIHLRIGTLKIPTTDDACSWHQAWLQLYNQSKESYESFIWGAASMQQQQLHTLKLQETKKNCKRQVICKLLSVAILEAL